MPTREDNHDQPRPSAGRPRVRRFPAGGAGTIGPAADDPRRRAGGLAGRNEDRVPLDQEGATDLFVIAADGSSEARLTSTPEAEASPTGPPTEVKSFTVFANDESRIFSIAPTARTGGSSEPFPAGP
jgi:hypothetical protein